MPQRISRPGPIEFLRVIWEDWGSRMSGIFSVPFTLAAVFSKAEYGKIIWSALAALAWVITVYQVWSKERKRVNELARSSTSNRRA